jgi:hypothetical protein
MASLRTTIGYLNPQLQRVIRCIGPSTSMPGQLVYEMECERPKPDGSLCGNRYGSNGPDIKGAGAGKGRMCPNCQRSAEGEPI